MFRPTYGLGYSTKLTAWLWAKQPRFYSQQTKRADCLFMIISRLIPWLKQPPIQCTQ